MCFQSCSTQTTFLSGVDFNELGACVVLAARGEDGVSVGQPCAALWRGGELVFRGQISFALELPDCFPLGIDFAGQAFLFIGYQGVAVF